MSPASLKLGFFLLIEVSVHLQKNNKAIRIMVLFFFLKRTLLARKRLLLGSL